MYYSLYADDNAMWTTCTTVQEGLVDMQAAIDRVLDWCHKWGFSLTVKKSKAVIFSRSRKFPNTSLLLNKHNIEYVSKIKILGVTLDKQLRWGPYIKILLEKCRSDLRILSVLSSRQWGAK